MGLFSDLRKVSRWAAVDAAAPRLASPHSTATLATVAFANLDGVRLDAVDRAAAMKVGAIVKGRALIAGLLARHPLRVYEADAGPDAAPLPAAGQWLTATSTPQAPSQRTLWTIDDYLFGGLSVWGVRRDSSDKIVDGFRVHPDYWTCDPDTHVVHVEGEQASVEEILLIEGPQEGLVTIAETTIRAALDLERAVSQRLRTPIPLQVLVAQDLQSELTPAEAAKAVDEWEARRQAGGTGYLQAGLKLETPGAEINSDSALFIQGRNAIRLDVANFMNLPAALLDGSMSTASLTYSTSTDKRNDLVDLSLGYWSNPLESRLSQDDVVDPGLCVRFDLSTLATVTQPTHSPTSED